MNIFVVHKDATTGEPKPNKERCMKSSDKTYMFDQSQKLHILTKKQFTFRVIPDAVVHFAARIHEYAYSCGRRQQQTNNAVTNKQNI